MRIERFRVGSNGAVVIWPAHGKGERLVVYHTGGGEDSEVLADPLNEKRGVFEALSRSGYLSISVTSTKNHWGSPVALQAHDRLWAWIGENLGFTKAGILCQSMGGLSAYNWAIKNARAVLGIYGVYPVTSLAAMLKGGLSETISQVYAEQGIDLPSRLGEFNPTEGIGVLCRNGIPVKHRHGDSDSLVEYVPNAVDFGERYASLGGRFELVTVRGLGHEANPAFFQPEEVVDFLGSLDWP